MYYISIFKNSNCYFVLEHKLICPLLAKICLQNNSTELKIQKLALTFISNDSETTDIPMQKNESECQHQTTHNDNPKDYRPNAKYNKYKILEENEQIFDTLNQKNIAKT